MTDEHDRDRLRLKGRDPKLEDACRAELEAQDVEDWEAARKPLPPKPPEPTAKILRFRKVKE